MDGARPGCQVARNRISLRQGIVNHVGQSASPRRHRAHSRIREPRPFRRHQPGGRHPGRGGAPGRPDPGAALHRLDPPRIPRPGVRVPPGSHPGRPARQRGRAPAHALLRRAYPRRDLPPAGGLLVSDRPRSRALDAGSGRRAGPFHPLPAPAGSALRESGGGPTTSRGARCSTTISCAASRASTSTGTSPRSTTSSGFGCVAERPCA